MQQPKTYPDVLGTLADDRLNLDEVLQCAIGVFPNTTAVGQPVEVLLLLQNLTDQSLPVQVITRVPTKDGKGNLLNLFTRRPRYAFMLPAGEVGLLHLPITPQLPTPPGKNYPVRVQINVQKPDVFGRVRAVAGGERPSLLAISPFRLNVLREIAFGANTAAPNQIVTTFDVLPGQFPQREDEPLPRYEALWTVGDMDQEFARARAKAPEALRFVNNLMRATTYPVIEARARDAYGDAGMPLHPGETTFITKMMLYVMEDGLELEEGFSLTESHWFRRLCQLMVDDAEVTQNVDRLLNLLFSSIVHDATLLSFSMVKQNTGIEFGNTSELGEYAVRLMAALEGREALSLEHVYVPLVLGGVLINARLTIANENPWHSLDAIKEARDGRISLAGAGFREVFDILDNLVANAERLLRETGVPRD